MEFISLQIIMLIILFMLLDCLAYTQCLYKSSTFCETNNWKQREIFTPPNGMDRVIWRAPLRRVGDGREEDCRRVMSVGTCTVQRHQVTLRRLSLAQQCSWRRLKECSPPRYTFLMPSRPRPPHVEEFHHVHTTVSRVKTNVRIHTQ